VRPRGDRPREVHRWRVAGGSAEGTNSEFGPRADPLRLLGSGAEDAERRRSERRAGQAVAVVEDAVRVHAPYGSRLGRMVYGPLQRVSMPVSPENVLGLRER